MLWDTLSATVYWWGACARNAFRRLCWCKKWNSHCISWTLVNLDRAPPHTFKISKFHKNSKFQNFKISLHPCSIGRGIAECMPTSEWYTGMAAKQVYACSSSSSKAWHVRTLELRVLAVFGRISETVVNLQLGSLQLASSLRTLKFIYMTCKHHWKQLVWFSGAKAPSGYLTAKSTIVSSITWRSRSRSGCTLLIECTWSTHVGMIRRCKATGWIFQ